jgi:hypothetical protein
VNNVVVVKCSDYVVQSVHRLDVRQKVVAKSSSLGRPLHKACKPAQETHTRTHTHVRVATCAVSEATPCTVANVRMQSEGGWVIHVCLVHPPAMSVTLSHAGISLGACHIVHSASKRSSGSRTCSVVEMIVMVIVVAQSQPQSTSNVQEHARLSISIAQQE